MAFNQIVNSKTLKLYLVGYCFLNAAGGFCALKEWQKTHGTPCRIRTYDLRLRRPLLYPTELRAHGYRALAGVKRVELYGQ